MIHDLVNKKTKNPAMLIAAVVEVLNRFMLSYLAVVDFFC